MAVVSMTATGPNAFKQDFERRGRSAENREMKLELGKDATFGQIIVDIVRIDRIPGIETAKAAS